MRFVMFYHSLVSDWNHGNAHFLRGVVSELLSRGHSVDVYEPRGAWSYKNLVRDQGRAPLAAFREVYPQLKSTFYDPRKLDLGRALADADVVLVHEWNDHQLVADIGRHRARTGSYRLLLHDTHHRCVTDPRSIERYDLRHYDGVLAFGGMIRDLYVQRGWAARAWTWHEAADTRVFFPRTSSHERRDLVWVGNWGDEERTAELHEYLLQPVKCMGLQATVFGVRYPRHGRRALVGAGIQYGGWLANFRVPETFAQYRTTVHVPRRAYRQQLTGIPTIRVFEALACGIPLVSAAWEDSEQLFTPGRDFLVARSGEEMCECLRELQRDSALAEELAAHGLETIRRRHTCAHRVDELLQVCAELCAKQSPDRNGSSTKRLQSGEPLGKFQSIVTSSTGS